MIDLIFVLQAELDVQSTFARYEEYQSGRGEVFIRQLDAALTLLRQHPEIAPVYSDLIGGCSFVISRMEFSIRRSRPELLLQP